MNNENYEIVEDEDGKAVVKLTPEQHKHLMRKSVLKMIRDARTVGETRKVVAERKRKRKEARKARRTERLNRK